MLTKMNHLVGRKLDAIGDGDDLGGDLCWLTQRNRKRGSVEPLGFDINSQKVGSVYSG